MKKLNIVYNKYRIKWSNKHRRYFIYDLKNTPIGHAFKIDEAKKIINEL